MNNIELEKKIKSLVHSLRYEKGLVSAVDVLLRLDYLSMKNYEDWRFGRVDYLEKVCNANLSKLTLINKTIRKIAKELKLKPSLTVYNKYGKGVKHKLKFSKSGNKNIEDMYATHYIDKKRIKEMKMKNAGVE
ncbi:MAG: hypothetical protein PF484_01980 [Bacteroidales bacterium]|jgi:hypothetical protein|nr:hypothetical protein [Bacteroidales bacterium]